MKSVFLGEKIFDIPEPGETNWGSLSQYLVALADEIQKMKEGVFQAPVPLRRRLRKVESGGTQNLSASDDVVYVQSSTSATLVLPPISTLPDGKTLTVIVKGTTPHILNATPGVSIDSSTSLSLSGDSSINLVLDKSSSRWISIPVSSASAAPGLAPVGSIVALASHLAGAWTPPPSGVVKDGWMRCDGANIPSGCTLSGTTPNLSDERFLRGATTSGASGGPLNSHTHTMEHTHTLSSELGSTDFSHTHTVGDSWVSFTNLTIHTQNGQVTFNKNFLNNDQMPHHHQYGAQYVVFYGAMGDLVDNRVLGLWHAGAGWVYMSNEIPNFGGGRPFNSNTASSFSTQGGKLVEVLANTTSATVLWNDVTVYCAVTNPTFPALSLNGAVNPHSHSVSTSGPTINLAHSHTTTSQSTSTTSAPTSVEVIPKFLNVIFLIRVV